MIVKLLTEHHLKFLSLKGSCRGSSESTLVKNVKLLEISCGGSNHNKILGLICSVAEELLNQHDIKQTLLCFVIVFKQYLVSFLVLQSS